MIRITIEIDGRGAVDVTESTGTEPVETDEAVSTMDAGSAPDIDLDSPEPTEASDLPGTSGVGELDAGPGLTLEEVDT